MRHKSFIRGGEVLRHCWATRNGWNLVSTIDQDDVKAYGYLAGGTPKQPKHTYALIFRKLPLPWVDQFYAMGLFLTKGACNPDCFVHHPRLRKSGRDKDELKQERIEAVQSQLQLLQQKSKDFVSKLC